jgi:hypothetical protein
MAWFKVDDGFHASRKLLKIPKRARFAAAGLWSIAGSWAADQLTDGHVPNYMISEWAPPPAAPDALVDAGLWERTHDGFAFYNWHEYQPSKQDVDAERAASRERMQELRARRKNRKPLEQAEVGDVFGRTVPNRSESVRNPDPTRPDPTHPLKDKEEADASSSAPRKRATRISEDFSVTPEMKLWASSKAADADLITETEKFINYWIAKSGKDATKLDWAATWRNWILNAKTSQTRPDHSARGLAKGMAMLQAYDAQQTQPFELEA